MPLDRQAARSKYVALPSLSATRAALVQLLVLVLAAAAGIALLVHGRRAAGRPAG